MPTLFEALQRLADREHYESATAGEHWVTIRGQHVLLDGSGTVVSGPKALAGKQLGHKPGNRVADRHIRSLVGRHKATIEHAGHTHKISIDHVYKRGWRIKHKLPTGEWQTHEPRHATVQAAAEHAAKLISEYQPPTPAAKDVPQTPKAAPAASSSTEPPRGVRVTKGGQWVGGATVDAAELSVDPSRFQYKISGIDPRTGVTRELKGVTKFNPLLAGQLLVWHDPADGKTYVVNGHHRAELAKRSSHWDEDETGWGWHGEMNVQYIPAKSASEARAMGALANIAEGRGTATDAAKFMRDTKVGVHELTNRGISLSGRIAADAPALAGLHPAVFQSLTTGITTEGRALAIARHLSDQDLQHQLLQTIQRKERSSSKDIPDSHVAEMAREMDLAGKTKSSGGGGLFGDLDDAKSLIFQRADLKAALRRDLAAEKNTFKAVSSDRRVERITGAGSNVLDVDTNRERAQAADEALWSFDKLANSRGPLSEAIQQHAEQLYHAPKKRKAILGSLKQEALRILSNEGNGTGAGALDRGSPTEGYSRANAAAAGRYGGRHPLTLALNARERYAKWSETDHPRGQPDNAGQFAAATATRPKRATAEDVRRGIAKLHRSKMAKDRATGIDVAAKKQRMAEWLDLFGTVENRTGKHHWEILNALEKSAPRPKTENDEAESIAWHNAQMQLMRDMLDAHGDKPREWETPWDYVPGDDLPPEKEAARRADWEKKTEIRKAFINDLANADLGLQYARAAYLKHLDAVLPRLGPRAVHNIQRNVQSWRFYDSCKELSEALRPAAFKIAGAWQDTGGHRGTVHVDGGDQNGDNARAAGIYAHELGHAADWFDAPHMQSPISQHWSWLVAFKDELAGGALSKYAATSPLEGFAEFARLVWATGQRHEDIAAAYPQCYEVFKDQGLVQ